MKPSNIFLALAIPLVVSLTSTNTWAANPEHLNQLETTGKCTNKCDLSGASLIGIDLANAQLQNANLNGANFAGANLSGANLTGASAGGANFLGANLQGATLERVVLVYANLVKAKMNNAVIISTDLQGANLVEADLTGAKVSQSSFVGANLYKIKASRSLTDRANGNQFKWATVFTMQDGENIEERQVTNTYEGGGSSRIIKRRYRIPAWVGTAITSTVCGPRTQNQPDQNGATDAIFATKQ
jgi:Pentapeptide repeats (8 copies)